MKLKKLIASLLFLSTLLLGIFSVPALAESGQMGPGVDEWWYIYIPSPDAQIDAIMAGDIDVTGFSRPEDYATLEEAGFTITRYAGTGGAQIYFNLRSERTVPYPLRAALAHLVPKSELIAQIFGPLAVEGISFLPEAFGLWYNPDVTDISEYDPELAEYILDQEGYTRPGADQYRIDPETGEELEPLFFVYCAEFTNWVPWVERLATEADAIGVPITLDPIDFGTWWTRVSGDGDFDITMMGWGWYDTPDIIPLIWRTGAGLPISGLSDPEFDALCDSMLSSLDVDEVKSICYELQESINQMVGCIPLFGYVYATAWDPELEGVFSTAYAGMFDELTYRWKDGVNPHTGTNILRFASGAQPSNVIPAWDTYAAGSSVLGRIGDCYGASGGMIHKHPLTSEWVPWLAKSWELEPWTDPELNVAEGTKMTIEFREGVYWHDSTPEQPFEFTADDAEFSLTYLKDKNAPLPQPHLDGMVEAKAIDRYTLEVYYNKTSVFLVNYVSLWCASHAKHIWNDDVTKYGEPAGIPEGSYEGQVGYGVQDPALSLLYKTDNPYKEGLTCLIGTGPYIWPPGGWAVEVSYHMLANRDYYAALLITDLNFDFKVDMHDLDIVNEVLGATVGDPEYHVNKDVNDDGVIDETDVARIEADLGKTWCWPLEFTFSDPSISPAEPKVGEEVTVTATVTNEGEDEATYQAIMKLDGSPVDYEDVTLGAGASTTVTFKVTKDEGSYNIDIGGETTTLTVAGLAPATFSVTGLTVSPSEIETGDSATVTATVENTGDLSGTYTAELKVNGATEDTKDVTVGVGESETVTFTVSKEEEGTYSIDVGGKTGTLTVTAPPKPTQTWLYVGAAAVVIVVIAVYFLTRRS